MRFENKTAVVTGGLEGLRLLEKNKDTCSLIILDVMMPDMNGFQVLQKIREKNNVPVLMLTAKEYRDYEDKIDRMQESIRQMAPQMRIVVEEFFLNEKKCAEISEILNISDNTVRTHIARALKILRKRLSVFLLITV